jgi:insertion element IS1 protein InsB
MEQSGIKCFRVSDTVFCPGCFGGSVNKNGRTRTGKQQYCCKDCGKRFISHYSYRAYASNTNDQIIRLLKEGVGMRGIVRLLGISIVTLLNRIRLIAAKLRAPYIIKGKQYEVDEIKTFVGSKKRKVWIAYALERESRRVVSFKVGNRTNTTLKPVLQTLLLSEAKTIYTDRYPAYKFLIPESLHRSWPRCTNHIERKNLSLRTHLKRLNRRSICFSKSAAILSACVKIYFWG